MAVSGTTEKGRTKRAPTTSHPGYRDQLVYENTSQRGIDVWRPGIVESDVRGFAQWPQKSPLASPAR
jgi:hypothetical protein